MGNENKRYSASEHVPACSTWPPPWLSAPPQASSTAPSSTSPKPPPIVSEAPAVQDDAEAVYDDAKAARVPPGFPPDAVIVVADENGYNPDDRRFSAPHQGFLDPQASSGKVEAPGIEPGSRCTSASASTCVARRI